MKVASLVSSIPDPKVITSVTSYRLSDTSVMPVIESMEAIVHPL
jgi:hypothetical protein